MRTHKQLFSRKKQNQYQLCTSKPFWTFRRQEESPDHTHSRTPAPRVVTVPNTISGATTRCKQCLITLVCPHISYPPHTETKYKLMRLQVRAAEVLQTLNFTVKTHKRPRHYKKQKAITLLRYTRKTQYKATDVMNTLILERMFK